MTITCDSHIKLACCNVARGILGSDCDYSDADREYFPVHVTVHSAADHIIIGGIDRSPADGRVGGTTCSVHSLVAWAGRELWQLVIYISRRKKKGREIN